MHQPLESRAVLRTYWWQWLIVIVLAGVLAVYAFYVHAFYQFGFPGLFLGCYFALCLAWFLLGPMFSMHRRQLRRIFWNRLLSQECGACAYCGYSLAGREGALVCSECGLKVTTRRARPRLQKFFADAKMRDSTLLFTTRSWRRYVRTVAALSVSAWLVFAWALYLFTIDRALAGSLLFGVALLAITFTWLAPFVFRTNVPLSSASAG